MKLMEFSASRDEVRFTASISAEAGLQETLEALLFLLRGVGFTYVESLAACKKDGTEVSSEDWH
jgi:hypothetical protein